MATELAVTTLWAALSTWSSAAAEIVLRPEYWAVHGATRMGKAITHDDRLDQAAFDGSCLAAGVSRASELMGRLAKADRAARPWREPSPPRVESQAEAMRALEFEHVASVPGDAVEQLHTLAHALQGGAPLARDATPDDVRRVLAAPPRGAPKSGGAFSGLLAMSPETLWAPTPLASAWDSPACVFASSVQLSEDLQTLPVCLRRLAPGSAPDLAAMGRLVAALEDALARAGDQRCVMMGG
jgi:hypothetical protein